MAPAYRSGARAGPSLLAHPAQRPAQLTAAFDGPGLKFAAWRNLGSTPCPTRSIAPGVLVGLIVAVLAAAAGLILSVQSTAELHVGTYHSLYTKYAWALAAALLLAGVAVVVAASTGARLIGAFASAGGVVVGAQLGATGAVAHHHWKGWFGPGQPGYGHLDELKLLSLALGTLCLGAVLLLIRALLRQHVLERSATSTFARAALAVIGLVVIAAVPYLLAVDDNVVTTQTYLAFAALFSVPWGVAIIASGWLSRWAAAGACVTVIGSAVLATTTDHVISVGSPDLAFGTAAALALLAGSVHVLGERSSEPADTD